MIGICISVESPSKKDIASLQTALTKINLKIDPQEIKNADLGQSTRDALSRLQSRTGLTADGNLNLRTVEKLNIELEHIYYASNKNRTYKVQSMLERLGYKLDPEEIKARTFGKSTEETLKSFQSKMGMQPDGLLKNELIGKLKEQDLKKRLESSNQVGNIQHTLLRTGRIAKLGLNIEANELKQKSIGPSTRAVIGAFQKKYGLSQTGELDVQTLERIKSVAASRPIPIKALKFKSASDLKPIKSVLRLNMTNKNVGVLQQSLAYMGYKVNEIEFKNKKFGKTTREAVMAYQRANSLPVTGHVESETLSSLNDRIKAANPQTFELNKSYRIRGTVRNELWMGQAGLKVQVYEKLLRGTGPMLAERKTGANGFFDIPYNPPRNPTDGKIKIPFHLLIRVFNGTNQELFLPGKVLFNPTLISWINFTAGTEPYRGVSEFETYMKSISKVLGAIPIAEIKETDDVQEITHVAISSGLSPEEVMRLVLAHRAALKLKNQLLGPEFFYSFILQNLPPNMPSDLLVSTEGWSLIEQLVDQVVNGIVFMDSELQAQAFENAVQNNLIPIATSIKKKTILSALADQKQRSALESPILVGNGSLKSLLSVSSVPPDHYNKIANTFLKHQGFGVEFWDDIKANASNLGGSDVVQDFETTTKLGQITKNHIPTLTFLKSQIANPDEPRINSTRDLAKLTKDDWVSLIKANGSQVPLGTDGDDQEKISLFASTLVSQSEYLFPTVAFCSKISTSSQHGLKKLPTIQKIIDKNPEFDLRISNIDKSIRENKLDITDDEIRSELRVMQRVNRLAPTAETGLALLELNIHNSAQIISLGKERFVSALAAKNIDQRTALTIHGYAEFQYAQVLMRLADYRSELHQVDPAAIVRHTYTAEEQKELLENIPDLETLFGPLDFCDCKHCQSVYGPAAYLADLLRFLQSHDSEQVDPTEPNAYRKVLGILFDRRPDIGNIKLNCDNTETPLPYTDLVCEILENAIPVSVSDVLENAIPAPVSDANFNYQTTRTREELSAFPENVRTEAYDTLKDADYPINSCFNLWQEEARIFLSHLGVKRFELMDLFQLPPNGDKPIPSNVSIAGEFWGISSHETEIIITQAATKEKKDNFWGFDTSSRTEIKVLEFLQHTKIEYYDLLSLLEVKWLNPSGAANPVYIPPGNEQMLKEQKLVNLTVAKFDQIHRLLRLWKHTDWELWEIDLLIRAPQIGNGNLDAQTLVRIRQFKQIQDRLKLGFEEMLSFYGKINTEMHVKPGEPSKIIQPLYINLFQNPVVTNPIDKKFAYDKLDPAEKLEDHRITLVAALALTEADLGLLLGLLLEKTDDKLTLDNLTILLNYANLAHALNYTIKDLLTLLNLTNPDVNPDVGDIFASPKQTLDFLEQQERIKESGFEIQELDYLLNDRPDSPYGLREDTITQYISTLRDSLHSSPTDMKDGQISSQIASTFSLTNEQADLLVRDLNLQQLTDNKLTEKDDKDHYITDIKPENFPGIYTAYRLLHKASLLVNHYKITSKEDLEWLLTKSTVYNGLDFKTLPVGTTVPAKSLFRAWLNLNNWLYFQSQYPQPEDITWRGIFDKARGNNRFTVDDVRTDLSKLTTWKVDDLKKLDLNLKACYLDVDTYMRLSKCFKQLKRLGVSASMVLDWAKRDDDGAQFITAQQIRQAAKSKYDYTVWLSIVKPLQDELRKKKRTALISYLIENSLRKEEPEITFPENTFNGKKYANPKYWRDANDLLSYFLIDVEMSACQLTSRVKQAISSVQMFVQRSFLNLEQPYVQVSREEKEDKVSMNSWKQWEWMKSYRIWEANRKVFLYPENWIEPELRDDKSSFFEELENEILQGEITHENCEAAFLNYLEKVNEVSRLEIIGIYHEYDDEDPQDDLPPDTNVLHVVGRTRSQPAIYYYRQFDLNYSSWTAWEKIDLDIISDHVIPVVYNRKLHLFWLIFTEKPQKIKKQPPVKASDSPTESPEPPKLLEIQLAWSVRKGKGWTSRKVASQKLIHPWERPHFSYNLKPRYKSRENQLWLDVYISTSQEFNNTLFYDPYKTSNGCICKENLTAVRYDETLRPWHSSSFVFDGNVVDLKLKALAGQYHILGSNGYASDHLAKTTSYQYVRDNFYQGAIINQFGRYETAPRLVLPDGMHYHNTRLVNNKIKFNTNHLNVLVCDASQTLLNSAQSPFEIVFSQHNLQFDIAKWENSPLFYQDYYRSFFIKPEWQIVIKGSCKQKVQYLKYIFYPFYHPYTALFIRELNRFGLEGLLNRRIQLFPYTYYPSNGFIFNATYGPTSLTKADNTADRDIIDFSRYGAYSIYNWEIFFHAPLLVACKLCQNQRFEEAMRWFHYIFDPTSTEALGVPQRYWVTKPFFERNSEDYRKQRIENILESIDSNLEEVSAWKNNPFKPHLIARYRPVAYQKTVVMKYIDNLIAWGDQLFRRDTLESINEATLLYILAYEMLGRRPIKVPNAQHRDYTYNELVVESELDPFGNKRVDVLLENFTYYPKLVIRTSKNAEPLPKLDVFYFGIPANDKLLSYWDTVEDRLFKIRHCANIEGIVRQLPLFEPPIDPALLVKAAAAGIDLGSVLNDTAAPIGQYRFRLLASRATEFCNEVRALGEKVLSVLERKDAEGLSLLQSLNQVQLLRAMTAVKKRQIEEANQTWAGLEKGLDVLDKRIEYYNSIPRMNEWETVGMVMHGLGISSEIVATVLNTFAGTAHLFPRIKAGATGVGGTPTATVEIGGDNSGKSSTNFAALFQGLSSILHQSGQMLEAQGNYTRRDEENRYQAALAEKEKIQLNKQIEAARIRYLIAEKELENHELQVGQAESSDEYMHSKYTNQQLYDWMLKQLATVYFQSYQLAYDMAKRAEKSYQFELGQPNTSFIQFGYWDSLKKGLLAGEKLVNDIHRMEMSYYEQNKRELEITKHISLAQYMPKELVTLKAKGFCTVTLPEWLFDLDYPGHYRRRIKSVSITIPCIVGPYTNVNCTLSLTTRNSVRLTDNVTDGYGDPFDANDTRFYSNFVSLSSSIATTNGQNDSGVFELNFNDERYMPFEGAGAISEWTISLPKENNLFDISTISDVILHIHYTAVASSELSELKKAANKNLNEVLPKKGCQLFSVEHDFGSDWYRLFNPAAGQDQVLTLTLKAEYLPFWVRLRSANKTLSVDNVDLIIDSSYDGNFDVNLQLPGVGIVEESMQSDANLGGMKHMVLKDLSKKVPAPALLGEWKFRVKKDTSTTFKELKQEDFAHVYLLVQFSMR